MTRASGKARPRKAATGPHGAAQPVVSRKADGTPETVKATGATSVGRQADGTATVKG